MTNEIEQMHILFDELFPICRSIMGEGYRESLAIIQKYMPLELLEFKTGQKVLNWEVPSEWVIKEAWIKDQEGNTIIDIKNCNLHVINYSDKIDKWISLAELKEHLYTNLSQKEAIPYVTSYYEKRWGFCMSENQKECLEDGLYHVYIDSEFIDGTLQVGETVLKGESEREILLTSYLCHPSMANNELSGPIVLAMLYNRIKNWKNRKLTYRFVINPETIGTIAYLSERGTHLKEKMYSGMVLNCMGGHGELHYKASRRGDSPLDELITHLHSSRSIVCHKREFFPTTGSDERQYCSPGFNMPYGQMSRVMDYPEYHTSLDTKEWMGIDNLYESLNTVEEILTTLEYEGYYINKYPYGEIKLGDYGLYPTINSNSRIDNVAQGLLTGIDMLNGIMTILNYADGNYKLSDMAKMLGKNVISLIPIVDILKDKGLIEGPYYNKGEKVL